MWHFWYHNDRWSPSFTAKDKAWLNIDPLDWIISGERIMANENICHKVVWISSEWTDSRPTLILSHQCHNFCPWRPRLKRFWPTNAAWLITRSKQSALASALGTLQSLFVNTSPYFLFYYTHTEKHSFYVFFLLRLHLSVCGKCHKNWRTAAALHMYMFLCEPCLSSA